MHTKLGNWEIAHKIAMSYMSEVPFLRHPAPLDFVAAMDDRTCCGVR